MNKSILLAAALYFSLLSGSASAQIYYSGHGNHGGNGPSSLPQRQFFMPGYGFYTPGMPFANSNIYGYGHFNTYGQGNFGQNYYGPTPFQRNFSGVYNSDPYDFRVRVAPR